MADNNYLTRKVNSDGVVPIKDNTKELNKYNALVQLTSGNHIGQYLPSPDVTGRLDSRTDKNLGDISYKTSEELETQRFKLQSDINRIGRGFANMGAVAATTALDTTLGSLFSAISGNWDNTLSNKFNEWQNNLIKNNPIHRPEGYDQQSVMKQFLSSVFWGDFLQNAGFTVGSMLGVAPLMALNLPAGASLVASSLVGALAESRMEGLNAKNDLQSNRYRDLSVEYNNRKGLATTQEELDNIDKWYAEKVLEIDKDSNTAGNIVYGSNAALLMATNIIGWGPILKSSTTFSKELAKKSTKTGIKLLDKSGKRIAENIPDTIDDVAGATGRNYGLSTIKNLGKNVVSAGSESFEEVAQGIISDTAQRVPSVSDFSLYGDNYEGRQEFDSSWNAFISSLKDAFDDKNTAIEALMGGITSVLGIPYIKPKINSKGKKSIGISWGGQISEFVNDQRELNRLNSIVETINKDLSSKKTQNLIKNLVTTKTFGTLEQEDASENNTFGLKNNRLGSLISTIVTFDDIGSISALNNMADSISNYSDEQLKELASSLVDSDGNYTFFDPNSTINLSDIRKQIEDNVTTLKNTINEYLKDKQMLEASGTDLTDSVKKNYIYGKAQVRDWLKRKETIASELYDLYKELSVEGRERIESRDEFVNLIANNKSFRDLFKKEIYLDPSIAPDSISELFSKIKDISLINKGINKFNIELKKIWQDPLSAVNEFFTKESEELELSRQKEIYKKLSPIKDMLVSSDSPIKDFISIIEDDTNDSYIIPEETAILLDGLESYGKGTKEYQLAKDFKEIFELNRNLIKFGDIANIDPDKIDSILNFVSEDETPLSSIEDYYNLLEAYKAQILTEEELDKLDKAYKNSKKASKIMHLEEQGSLSEVNPFNEDNNLDDYDEKSDDELREYAANAGEELIPDLELLNRDEIISALRALEKGNISTENPFNPEKFNSNGDEIVNQELEVPKSLDEDGDISVTKGFEVLEDNITTEKEGSFIEIVDPYNKKSGIKSTIEKNGTAEEDPSNSEDAFAVGRLGSPYNITELKKHRIVPIKNFNNNFGAQITLSSGIEDFINKGYLYDWIKEKTKNKEPLTIGFAVLRDKDNMGRKLKTLPIFAVIEHPKGTTEVYDSSGNKKTVQILGQVSSTLNKSAKEVFDLFKDNIYNDLKNRVTPKGGKPVSMLSSISSELEYVFSGRFITENENFEKGNHNLLDIMPRDDSGNIDTSNIQFVVYADQDGVSKVFNIGEKLNGTEIPLNKHNTPRSVGVIWMKVREGNGQIFHKYVKLKKFSPNSYPLDSNNKHHIESPVYKKIVKAVESIINNDGSLDKVKSGLKDLHNYLYIPEDKKIIVNTEKGIARIGKNTISITDDNALKNFISLIYNAGYTFNIGNLTKEDLVLSDIFITNLAQIYNSGQSMLIKQVVFNSDGTYNLLSSNFASTIEVHTGNKGFQKGKQFRFANIEGKSYQKSDEGYFIYDEANDERTEITDENTISLINTYFDIKERRIHTKKYWKSRKNPLYVIEGFPSNTLVALVDGTLHVLTNEEILEYNKTIWGISSKAEDTKSKTITFRIGRHNVPARSFGKTHYNQKPEFYIFKDKNRIKFTDERLDDDSIIAFKSKDSEKINIVPNYNKKGVLQKIAKGEFTLLNDLFDIEGSFEVGKIPKIISEASIEVENTSGTIYKGKLKKGKIEWVPYDFTSKDNEVSSDKKSTVVDPEDAIIDELQSTEEIIDETPSSSNQLVPNDKSTPVSINKGFFKRKLAEEYKTKEGDLSSKLYSIFNNEHIDFYSYTKELKFSEDVSFKKGLENLFITYPDVYDSVKTLSEKPGVTSRDILEFIINEINCR